MFAKIRLFAPFLAWLLQVGTAQGEEVPSLFPEGTRFYSELRGGVGVQNNSDVYFKGRDDRGKIKYNSGWITEGALGFVHNNGLRGELAFGYRDNDVDDVRGLGRTVDPNASVASYSIMASVIYEFDYNLHFGDATLPSAFRPFLGFGFGGAAISDDHDNDEVFAYQAIGGLSYALTDNWFLTATYIYFTTDKVDFGGIRFEYYNESLMGGIRFRF
ncbi:MAG TPA: outer membrane beta-barrel protein [Kiloniellaceae bacterium]|nr:outer membrane beta-barrel protein [Kiloniellaceae bacterium]